MKRKFLCLSAVALLPFMVNAQAVTEVITTYDGYWKSSSTTVNATLPDNSHDLLAFRYNGTLFSTGVNDAILTDSAESYSPQVFKAIPVLSLNGTVVANTKIALGQLYDGVDNGPSLVPPVNDIPAYLTDGINGLNLGTGCANLPSGTLEFEITGLQEVGIGDGIPDILITQIAQPTGGVDSYEFLDVNGNPVGDLINISFSGIDSVGNWLADFYEASNNPMTLTSGFTKSPRPIRIYAADLSDFGITAGNYQDIVSFRINLNGNSDVAFIAYNQTSLVLPVTFADINSSVINNKDVAVSWKTLSEQNNDHFEVETSQDGKHFMTIGTITGAGNSYKPIDYKFIHKNAPQGLNYYRIKQVDLDSKSAYSTITQSMILTGPDIGLKLYPNPARKIVKVYYPNSVAGDKVSIYSINGKKVWEQKVAGDVKEQTINLEHITSGTYILNYKGRNGNTSLEFIREK